MGGRREEEEVRKWREREEERKKEKLKEKGKSPSELNGRN